MYDSHIDEALDAYVKAAYRRKENAAYGGEHHDGGYQHSVDLVKAYIAGVDGSLPPFIDEKYFIEAKKVKEDPDYIKYLELKKKFG